MSRHRSSSKRPPPEIGLHMECEEEELEPSQVAYYSKAEREYNEVQSKLDNCLKKMKAEIIESGEHCVVLQMNGASSGVVSPSHVSTPSAGGKTARQSVQTSQNYQQMPGQGILTRSNTSTGTNAYLVMDSRLSFVVGQMPASAAPKEQVTASASSKTVPAGRARQQPSITGGVMVTTRAKSSLRKGSSSGESDALTSTVIRTRQQEKTKSQSQQSSPQTPPSQPQQVFTSGSVSSGPGTFKIKVNAKPGAIQPVSTNESSAIGGLSTGGKAYKSGSDDSGSGKSTADSKEVTFSRLTGKIFPSLVVVARPHLKLKYISQSTIQQERSALDAKVKGVLMYSSTKFIEWLIQQGLLRSEQICKAHVNSDLTPLKLKLGMYSDVSKFPYSGGYVWISDCCPQQFVSVFSGSIFEGAPHPPTTLLKLIYHWACQTNVQNVVQWVKVDNLYLKNFYTYMRAVCTQAVHEKFKKLGGLRKKIEVGVISLGTTSQDGNKRQVKVEVLGVMDQENKSVRLRAVEPLSEERSFKKRFVKILEPLTEWVHKDSVILTDFTVAKAALNSMGFYNVYQVTNDSKLSNQNVMDYLRRIVPRMFQNTLSLLSLQIIQQFLDELVWREMWGPIPSQAFITIISHLAEQTKLDSTENFLVRLNKVASNPFKQWNYSAWQTLDAGKDKPSSKSQQAASSSSQESILEVTLDSSETSSSGKGGIRTRKRAAEQPLPETPSSVKKAAKISAKEKQKKEEKTSRKESADNLSDEIIKFINEGNQIPLESYYYGSRMADRKIDHAATGPFNVKCCVCNKRFTDNVVLMKHMILHSQTEPALVVNLKKVHQCELCFIGFNTSTALKVHMQETHSFVDGKITSSFLCHICEEKFSGRVELIYHMQRIHVQLEMPYECGVCHFRTSVYRVFVDHFTQVHSHEDHVFCPYCLKSVTFSFKGEAIVLNVLFYMSHLEKHQRRTLIKDCDRCQLSFIHKGILDQHMEADHVTWKDETGVTPIERIPTGVLMPEPSGVIKPSPGVKPLRAPKTKNMFSINKFKGLEVYGLDEEMACVECEGSLTFSEHFTGNFSCLKCRYASCCEKAMVEHFAIFHETTHPQFTKGRPIILPEELHCLCGYSTTSGNRIARHLALCERESAYPSREAVAAALEARESDAEDQSKQEGQNVLNMLGLVRKSPEGVSGVGSGGSESVKEEEGATAGATAAEGGRVEPSAAEKETEPSESGAPAGGKEASGEGDEEEETDEEGAREDLSVPAKEGSVAEVAETQAQEESDTSESQQDNSVINLFERKEEKEKAEEDAAEGTEEKPSEERMEITEANESSAGAAEEQPTTRVREEEEEEEEEEMDVVETSERKTEEECGVDDVKTEENEKMEVSEDAEAEDGRKEDQTGEKVGELLAEKESDGVESFETVNLRDE